MHPEDIDIIAYPFAKGSKKKVTKLFLGTKKVGVAVVLRLD